MSSNTPDRPIPQKVGDAPEMDEYLLAAFKDAFELLYGPMIREFELQEQEADREPQN